METVLGDLGSPEWFEPPRAVLTPDTGPPLQPRAATRNASRSAISAMRNIEPPLSSRHADVYLTTRLDFVPEARFPKAPASTCDNARSGHSRLNFNPTVIPNFSHLSHARESSAYPKWLWQDLCERLQEWVWGRTRLGMRSRLPVLCQA